MFSSHQLDLVEGLCESITMIDAGRVVLEGDVAELKRESPDRYLRVDAQVEPDWLAGLAAELESADHRGSRVRLAVGADPVDVLDAVRRHAAISDFAVETPSLSELFLGAIGGAPVGEVP